MADWLDNVLSEEIFKKEEVRESAREYYEKARKFEEEGELDKALRFYRRVVALDPTDAYAYNFMGRIYLEQGNYSKAIECFMQAINLNGNHVWAFYNAGIAYKKWGVFEEAERYLMQALDRGYVPAVISLLELYLEMEKYESIPKLLKYSRKVSSYHYWHYLLGKYYYLTGDEVKARREFTKAVILNNEDEYSYSRLIERLYDDGFLKLAFRYLKKALKKFPFSLKLRYLYAFHLYKIGSFEDAVHELKKIISVDSNYKEARILLAKLYNYLNLPEMALKIFGDTFSPAQDLSYEELVILAESYYLLGRYNQSLQLALDAISMEPALHEGYLIAAKVYYQKGLLKDALKILERGLAYNEHVDLLKEKWRLLNSLGELEAAFEIAERLKKLGVELEDDEDEEEERFSHLKRLWKNSRESASTEELLEYASMLRKRQAFEEAREVYEYLLLREPDNGVIAMHYEKVMAILEGKSGQIADLELAVVRDPENPELHWKLGLEYLKLGKFDLAEREMASAVVLAPTSERVLELAKLYEQLYSKSKVLEFLKKHLNFPEVTWRMFEIYLEMGEFEKAEYLLNSQIPEDKKRTAVGLLAFYRGNYEEAYKDLLGSNYYKQLAEVALKLEKYEDALRYADNVDDERVKHYIKGVAYKQLEDMESALREFSQLVKRWPDDEFAWYNLGLLYSKLGNFAKAREAFNRVIKLNPEDVYAYNQLGKIMVSVGVYDEALTYYKAAYVLQPNDLITLRGLAKALEGLGKVEEASKIYKRMYSLKKDVAVAFKLATCYEEMRDYKKALEWWQKVLEEADPTSSMANFARDALRRLKSKVK